MRRSSIPLELAAGAVGAAIIVALAMLFTPALAAPSDAPVHCFTPTAIRIAFQSADEDVQVDVYRGTQARAFERAMTLHAGPPPPELRLSERTVAVGTYTMTDQRVEIAFYELVSGMECRFWGTVGSTFGLSGVLRDMGTGA